MSTAASETAKVKACAHVYMANGGRGGPPEFRRGPNSREAVMLAQCNTCGLRAWLTRPEWDELGPMREPRT
jgi:hypothetical protein